MGEASWPSLLPEVPLAPAVGRPHEKTPIRSDEGTQTIQRYRDSSPKLLGCGGPLDGGKDPRGHSKNRPPQMEELEQTTSSSVLSLSKHPSLLFSIRFPLVSCQESGTAPKPQRFLVSVFPEAGPPVPTNTHAHLSQLWTREVTAIASDPLLPRGHPHRTCRLPSPRDRLSGPWASKDKVRQTCFMSSVRGFAIDP